MITIAELFPLWRTSTKWLRAFREITSFEEVRLEKEYIVITDFQDFYNHFDGVYYDASCYILDGSWHRSGDRPALVAYRKNKTIVTERWHVQEYFLAHREGGKPAMIWYHENGVVARMEWWEKGERLDSMNFDENGEPLPTMISGRNNTIIGTGHGIIAGRNTSIIATL